MTTQRSPGSSALAQPHCETAFVNPAGRCSRACALPKLAMGAALALAVAFSDAAFAEHLSWQKHSSIYDVYLGVVTASDARHDEELTRMHRKAAHGNYRTRAATRHVMVSVFRRPSGERVDNADVVAEVIENDLIHQKRTKKPLELMPVYGMASYCNYFDLHWNGKYRIEVSIREPGRGPETVSFLQEATGLPK